MSELHQVGTSEVLRFSHAAMATTFECLIADQEREYARQAAAEVFRLIDRIEGDLSRFRQSSDVSAINGLAPGVSIRVGIHAFECLKAARAVYDATDGAFDVTIGPLMALWRSRDAAAEPPGTEELAAARALVGMDGLQLDAEGMEVSVTLRGLQVDLGGIGKGYALDQAAELLQDWGVDVALLNGGESTVLAVGAPGGLAGWPLGIGGNQSGHRESESLTLCDRALSGSGVDVKGTHILNPHTGDPVEDKLGAWAICDSAANADALSTAFMVMSPDAVERYCAGHAGTGALLLVKDGEKAKAIRFGV